MPDICNLMVSHDPEGKGMNHLDNSRWRMIVRLTEGNHTL